MMFQWVHFRGNISVTIEVFTLYTSSAWRTHLSFLFTWHFKKVENTIYILSYAAAAVYWSDLSTRVLTKTSKDASQKCARVLLFPRSVNRWNKIDLKYESRISENVDKETVYNAIYLYAIYFTGHTINNPYNSTKCTNLLFCFSNLRNSRSRSTNAGKRKWY